MVEDIVITVTILDNNWPHQVREEQVAELMVAIEEVTVEQA